MFDTVRIQWQGISWGPDLADWLRSEYPTAEQHTRYYDVNLPWQGMSFQDDVLGMMGVKSNKLGNFVWAERSLPKFMHGDNCRVLSVNEAREGVAAWVAGVEHRFQDWWEMPNYHATATVKRLDLCYQTKVPCSSEVFTSIARCVKAKRVVKHQWVLDPVQVELGGVSLHQSRLEMARWYDKGIESGDERYLDVVRHEEQLRGGKAGYLLDVSGAEPMLRVEHARDRMNARYAGWGQVQSYDLGALIEKHGNTGAAAALLVIHPEYDALYKRKLSNGSYYRIKNLALEGRRQQFTADLRLPGDSWAEPMVL
jgi:hypothetical protein